MDLLLYSTSGGEILAAGPETRQPFKREVGLEEVLGGAVGGEDGFGGEIAAADGAFHGGGPGGGGPVAGKEKIVDGAGLRGAEAVGAGSGRESGGGLFDDGGFQQAGVAGGGENFAEFAEAEVGDFRAREWEEGAGGGDDELEVLSGRDET